jgi:hypothetical protein
MDQIGQEEKTWVDDARLTTWTTRRWPTVRTSREKGVLSVHAPPGRWAAILQIDVGLGSIENRVTIVLLAYTNLGMLLHQFVHSTRFLGYGEISLQTISFYRLFQRDSRPCFPISKGVDILYGDLFPSELFEKYVS